MTSMRLHHTDRTECGAHAMPPNNRVNAPVRPVTPRACARVAPGRPAGYALR